MYSLALMSEKKTLEMEELYTKDLKKIYPQYCCKEEILG